MKLKKLQLGGYVPSQYLSKDYTPSQILKAQKRALAKAGDSGLLEIIPIYGTYKSGERFVKNPNIGTGIETGISVIGDIATGGLLGAATKGVKAYNKATKAYKQIDNLNEEKNQVLNLILNSAPTKRAALIKKQQNASKSLSLMERTPKVQQEILKHQRKINWLKEASPEEILSNDLSKQSQLFYNRKNKIYLNDAMPNSMEATKAFNTANDYGMFLIPAKAGQGELRYLNNNSTIFNSKSSEKDMKNHY